MDENIKELDFYEMVTVKAPEGIAGLGGIIVGKTHDDSQKIVGYSVMVFRKDCKGHYVAAGDVESMGQTLTEAQYRMLHRLQAFGKNVK